MISIIGVLVALIMPATNSARESGRRAQCAANLHQMALGCLQCESANGYYPSGGWGWQWAGEGDRGYGMMQPAGWHYNILPYIDQADLRNMDKGLIKIGDTSSSNSAQEAGRYATGAGAGRHILVSHAAPAAEGFSAAGPERLRQYQ